MSKIFPGMDPYLEDPLIWPEVHASLIIYIRNQLQPRLRPRYVASIEQRVYLQRPTPRDVIPDVGVRRNLPNKSGSQAAVLDADTPVVVTTPGPETTETYLQILDRQSGQTVVTVLEAVSPTNKYAGPGRLLYEPKQREVLDSQANLVEIDLLRHGPHLLAVPEGLARSTASYHYLVSVNRAVPPRMAFELYPRDLRDRLPRVRIPLTDADADIVLDLQAVFDQAYEDGSYRDRLHYDRPCVPRLSPEDQAWADERIRAAREIPQAAEPDA